MVPLLHFRSVSASDLQAGIKIILVVWPISNNADIEDNAGGALEDSLVVEDVFAYGKCGATHLM